MATEQHARSNQIAATLDRNKIPQATLAKLSGLSQPGICLYLNGKRGLTLDAQIAVLRAVRFLCELAEESKAPIDFSNIDALWPLWLEHQRLEREEQLIGLANEEQTT